MPTKIKQSKADAVTQLMYEARKEKKISQTAVDRCVRACKFLGLNEVETIEVLGWLDICDKQGAPWQQDITIKIGRATYRHSIYAR